MESQIYHKKDNYSRNLETFSQIHASNRKPVLHIFTYSQSRVAKMLTCLKLFAFIWFRHSLWLSFHFEDSCLSYLHELSSLLKMLNLQVSLRYKVLTPS